MNCLILYAAIAFEVVGTTSLKLSEGLTRPGWFALCLALYGTSFALLAMSLKVIPADMTPVPSFKGDAPPHARASRRLETALAASRRGRTA
jgi:hypothetical protein